MSGISRRDSGKGDDEPRKLEAWRPKPTPALLTPSPGPKKLNIQQPAYSQSASTTPKNTRQHLRSQSKSTSKKAAKKKEKRNQKRKDITPKPQASSAKKAAAQVQSAQLKSDWVSSRSFVKAADPTLGLLHDGLPPQPASPSQTPLPTASTVETSSAPASPIASESVVDSPSMVAVSGHAVLSFSSSESDDSDESDGEQQVDVLLAEQDSSSSEELKEAVVVTDITTAPLNVVVFTAIQQGDFSQIGSIPHLPQATSGPRCTSLVVLRLQLANNCSFISF